MRKYTELEIELINIQIGCILRLKRLQKGLSQQELAVSLESNSTMIGRIERFENISGWDKIFLISNYLQVDFCDLFKLKNKNELLKLVNESLKLEDKLTQDKKDYYHFLQKSIDIKYEELNKSI